MSDAAPWVGRIAPPPRYQVDVRMQDRLPGRRRMRSAWKRAKFLGVRDSFIDEYRPEGGVEVSLIDTMAQAYFLQLHWTEEAVRRTKADPRRETYEYNQWQQYKREAAKAPQGLSAAEKSPN